MTNDLERAGLCLRSGDWTAALDLAWPVHESMPGDDRPLRIAAVALAHLGRASAARAAADAATVAEPSNARTWLARAHVDLVGSDVDHSSLRAAQRAAFLDPTSADTQWVLGKTRLALGEYDSAIRALAFAVRLDPLRQGAAADFGVALASHRERAEVLRGANMPSDAQSPRRVADRMSRVVTYALLALVALLAPPVLMAGADLAKAATLVCVVGAVLLVVTAVPALLSRLFVSTAVRTHTSIRQRARVAVQLAALGLSIVTAVVDQGVGGYLAAVAVGLLVADAVGDVRLPRRRDRADGRSL